MSRKRISYANVASTLALVMVMAGGAYAAATLPRNSVGTRQLKKNAVKTAKVDNGTLLFKDIKKGQVDPSNMRSWGPVGMNVDDTDRTLVTLPGMKLIGECTRDTNSTPDPSDDEITMHVEFAATVQHLSYRSYDEDGSPYDNDDDFNPGEGANWGDWANAAAVNNTVSYPRTFSATVVKPNGDAVLSRHVMIANRGTADCSFLGRFDLV